MQDLLDPIYAGIDSVSNAVPGIMGFSIIVGLGYLLSSFIGWIIRKILYKINIDKRLRNLELHDSIGEISIAKLSGIITKWYLFMLFLGEGVSYLELGVVSNFIGRIIVWLPDLIISIAIIIAGLILIDFVIHRMLELKNRYVKIVASIIKVILIIIVIFTAIEQLGIKTSLAQNLILMVVAAVLVTFSIALGIGFGLSLKDELRPIIKKYTKKFR